MKPLVNERGRAGVFCRVIVYPAHPLECFTAPQDDSALAPLAVLRGDSVYVPFALRLLFLGVDPA